MYNSIDHFGSNYSLKMPSMHMWALMWMGVCFSNRDHILPSIFPSFQRVGSFGGYDWRCAVDSTLLGVLWGLVVLEFFSHWVLIMWGNLWKFNVFVSWVSKFWWVSSVWIDCVCIAHLTLVVIVIRGLTIQPVVFRVCINGPYLSHSSLMAAYMNMSR